MKRTHGYNSANDKQTEMNTLTAVLNKATINGYTASFSVQNKKLQLKSEDIAFTADDVNVINFYRFEGDSDPSDNVILYIIEVPGYKGTLVDAYGPYADKAVSDFMEEVTEIHKKVDKA